MANCPIKDLRLRESITCLFFTIVSLVAAGQESGWTLSSCSVSGLGNARALQAPLESPPGDSRRVRRGPAPLLPHRSRFVAINLAHLIFQKGMPKLTGRFLQTFVVVLENMNLKEQSESQNLGALNAR